jgi:hypothetical protein
MEIKEKKVKEIEEIVGYKCDICNRKMDLDLFSTSLELNIVKYTLPCGSYGERNWQCAHRRNRHFLELLNRADVLQDSRISQSGQPRRGLPQPGFYF